MVTKTVLSLVLLVFVAFFNQALYAALTPLQTTASLTQVKDGTFYHQTSWIFDWAGTFLVLIWTTAMAMTWMTELSVLGQRVVNAFDNLTK